MDINITDQIRPVTDFRKNTARLLKQLREDRQPMILTQRGRGVAVIIDVETYERLDYEHRFRTSVRNGLEDLAKGRSHSHSHVMRGAQAFLKATKSK